ncbi:MAG: hypothetical protein ABIG61_02730 [Planctomycetota bacterium]
MFVKRWQEELNLPSDATPHAYYDLDYMLTFPNMDPHIKSFQIIRQNSNEIILKSGFEAIVRKKFDTPMPEAMDWQISDIKQLEAFEFDDPYDKRRYLDGGDNHIASIGDTRIWESGDKERIRVDVLRKLNAAKGEDTYFIQIIR